MVRRLALFALALAPACDDDEFLPVLGDDDDQPLGRALSQARLFVVHDANTGSADLRVQAEGTPWERLVVGGPIGRILDVTAGNELNELGLTHVDLASRRADLDTILERFPEGAYPFEGLATEEDRALLRDAELTHDVPAAPDVLTPADDAVVDGDDVLISWQAVTTDRDGDPIDLVGYRVVVTEAGAVAPSDADWRPALTVHLPADTTRLDVPSAFLREDVAYRVEVVAIEASGNETVAVRAFRTE